MKINSALELSVLKLCICPKGRHYQHAFKGHHQDQVNLPYYKPNSQTAIAKMRQQCSLWVFSACSNAQIVRS
jgi:hypothetical protein